MKVVFIVLLSIFSLIVFGTELNNLFMTILNYRAINKYKKKKYQKVLLEDKFNIILPCYCEYELLEETIDYFNNSVKELENISIIIVTGNEYKKGMKVENNSYEQIKKIIQKKKINLELLFDETEYSTKSTKLNYALKYLENKKCLYIGVFDFDARPSINVIKFIENDIANKLKKGKKLPCVYQQITCITRHINKDSFFSKIFSIWHYRRSLGIEGIRSYKDKERFVKYCVGAGIFYSYKDIINIGGFPMYSDDIELGYNMQLQNKKVVIVPYVNSVSGVNSYIQGRNQYLRIYDGLFTSRTVLKKFLQREKVSLRKRISYLLNNYFDIFYEMIELTLFLLWIIIDFKILLLIYVFMTINMGIYYYFFRKISSNKVSLNIVDIFIGPFLNIAFRSLIIIEYAIKKHKIKELYFTNSMKCKSDV